VVEFLDAAEALPRERRVAAFDNDGTLWCERPTFVQYDFLEDALRSAVTADPSIRRRAEYAAILDGDQQAVGRIDLERMVMALMELFVGHEPEEFTRRARAFMAEARHRTLGIGLRRTVYQPMLELIDELRRRDFTVFVVSGGGTEFVRAVSDDLYGVPPEGVVGTLIEYDFVRREDGRPALLRTNRIEGGANEGAAKVGNIQTQLGRRPIIAGGNSAGDREMLEWACAADGASLAILVDHDDADREFAYTSTAQTLDEAEPIIDVGKRLGWTIVSMKNDWATVFPT